MIGRAEFSIFGPTLTGLKNSLLMRRLECDNVGNTPINDVAELYREATVNLNGYNKTYFCM